MSTDPRPGVQALNAESGFGIAGARAAPPAPAGATEEELPFSTESGSGLFAMFAE